MSATANIRAVITADDKASAVFKKFGNETEKAGEKTSKSFNNSWLAVTAATAGIVAFGKKSLDAFSQQELAITRLQAGINNVRSATDKHIDSLISQSVALQKSTRFSDEAYISAQGILTTFQLNQQAIEKLTPRLADMSEGLARVSGGMPDLEGNAILVAKAIGGEDVNGLVGALRRVGVLMTNTQQELLQTGTVEDRVSLITQVLDQNFKGLAEAAGTTTAGKIAILKNQFNDLQEKVGTVIAQALGPLLDFLNKHPAVLTGVTLAVGALATAFVALKVSVAISAVFSAASVAITGVGIAATATTSALSAMTAVSIAVWATGIAGAMAVAAGGINTFNSALSHLQNKKNEVNAKTAPLINSLRAQGKNAEADKLQGMVNELNAQKVFGFAGGTNFAPGGLSMVGEQGPELVNLPRGSQVIPADDTAKMLSGETNIVVNIGMYAGTEMEKRRIAKDLMRAFNDAQAMGGA